MCSLVDRVPEPKKTQLYSIQPYSAGPAEQSVPEPVAEVSVIVMSSLVFILQCIAVYTGATCQNKMLYGCVAVTEITNTCHVDARADCVS